MVQPIMLTTILAAVGLTWLGIELFVYVVGARHYGWRWPLNSLRQAWRQFRQPKFVPQPFAYSSYDDLADENDVEDDEEEEAGCGCDQCNPEVI